MKPLESETNFSESLVVSDADECAALLADTVPLVMRAIRAEMRRYSSSDLSVLQFRALLFIGRHRGASLSDVAEQIGLTLPSISKMIDRLEARDLVVRRAAPGDRRRICPELTPLGKSTLQAAAASSRDHLAEQLSVLSPAERAIIVQAMHSLHSVFNSEQTIEDDSANG